MNAWADGWDRLIALSKAQQQPAPEPEPSRSEPKTPKPVPARRPNPRLANPIYESKQGDVRRCP